MKKIFGLCVSFIVIAVGLCSVPAFGARGYTPSYGMRVEKYSTGGTFNLSKPHVVAPAVGHVNTTGQAQLVGYYSHRRHHNMIPRHNGMYKTYDRKTVKRTAVNKTRYRDADSARKTRYRIPEYKNKTLEAYSGR